MCAFQIRDKAPGVYIDEIDVPGPIAGVATGVAAFVGPALSGPIGEPRLVTSWTEFDTVFGDPDPAIGPYITNPRHYAANAVEGYFANGGSRCYFVRVGTAVRAWRAFRDLNQNNTLRVTAKQDGTSGNQITAEIRQAPSIASTQVVSETAPTTGTVQPPAGGVINQIRLAQMPDAAKFRVGDSVEVSDPNGPPEEGQIGDMTGDVLTLDRVLTRQFAQGDVRHADLTAGQTRLRVEDPSGIDPGSNLEFAQAGGPPAVVRTVNRVEGGTGFLELAAALGNDYDLTAGTVDVDSREFSLVVNGGAETFEPLSRDPRHSRYFASVVSSQLVDVSPMPTQSVPPDDMPDVAAATNLQGGANDDLFKLGAAQFEAGVDALRTVDEVTIVCVPDRSEESIQRKMIEHCEEMQDRFAVLDAGRGLSPTEVGDQLRGTPGRNSVQGFAALYYPWIEIRDPTGPNGARLTVPPSGHVAGLYARVDDDRGVFKAPANEALRGTSGLERRLTETEIGLLNEQSVNCIRTLPARGVVVWGARTIAPTTRTQWRYVNVRRFLLFIEESIQEATEFAVFEPNEPTLWETIKRQVTGFLTPLWAAGALFGATPEDAFRVRVDEELNPPPLRSLGQLVIEVIVCPTTPAEFIVFRVIQRPNGPLIEE